MKSETKMSNLLSDIPRRNAFNVPDGYFEELPTAVLSKCSVSKVKKKPFLASKPLWWSVAACGLLLLGIWFAVPNATPLSDSLLAGFDFCVMEICDDYFLDLLGSFDFFELFNYDFFDYH
ncbi:MAG: hypothetical protein FWC94_02275 [Bacteroidales bacterium]|nr:hypothetical protein [Bacteroidales bacterium]